jgi:hypothetical protein
VANSTVFGSRTPFTGVVGSSGGGGISGRGWVGGVAGGDGVPGSGDALIFMGLPRSPECHGLLRFQRSHIANPIILSPCHRHAFGIAEVVVITRLRGALA